MTPELHHWWPPSDWSAEWALVILTGFLFAVTGFLALYTYRLWKDASKSLKHARTSADAATRAADAAVAANAQSRMTFVADQRAWVSAEVSLTSGFGMLANGGPGVWLSCTLKNTGKTQAVNVHIRTEMHLRGEGDQALKYLQTLADGLRQLAAQDSESGRGYTLFPGDRFLVDKLVYLEKDEVDKHDDLAVSRGEPKPTSFIYVIIIGCIDYGIMQEMDRRQTAFVFDLMRTLPVGVKASAFERTTKTFPLEMLSLHPARISGRFTN